MKADIPFQTGYSNRKKKIAHKQKNLRFYRYQIKSPCLMRWLHSPQAPSRSALSASMARLFSSCNFASCEAQRGAARRKAQAGATFAKLLGRETPMMLVLPKNELIIDSLVH
jgi:hypothetical protein